MSALEKYEDVLPEVNDLSGKVVNCAFQVHKKLGPGFLEVNYEDAFIVELEKSGLMYERQKSFKIPYKDTYLNSSFRFDLIVENRILIEMKAVDNVHPVHKAQIYAYLKATGLPVGLIINFNVPLIKDGISRFVLRTSESPRENMKCREMGARG